MYLEVTPEELYTVVNKVIENPKLNAYFTCIDNLTNTLNFNVSYCKRVYPNVVFKPEALLIEIGLHNRIVTGVY